MLIFSVFEFSIFNLIFKNASSIFSNFRFLIVITDSFFLIFLFIYIYISMVQVYSIKYKYNSLHKVFHFRIFEF